ncbi:hypothetical protein J2S71_001203 [Olsenella profusa DSM 13989]|nr:hypothetical protein [Olsenella profusa DSM 13989]
MERTLALRGFYSSILRVPGQGSNGLASVPELRADVLRLTAVEHGVRATCEPQGPCPTACLYASPLPCRYMRMASASSSVVSAMRVAP